MKTQLTQLEFKLLKLFYRIDEKLATQSHKTVLLNLLVSGGKDSMCLLSALHTVLNSNKFSSKCKYILIVTHFNHKKRGLESEKDSFFVQDKCLELGVECIVKTILSNQQSGNFQNFAREERKRVSLEVARSYTERIGAQNFYILTAHHAQDHVESVLFHLIRGSGVAGLQGFYGEQPEHFLKPFAEIQLKDILKYQEECKVQFREDSSNLCDDYSRNLLRHNVLPTLEQINPQYDLNILKFSQKLSELLNEFEKKHIEISPQDVLNFKIFETTTTTELYLYLKSHFSPKMIEVSENTLKNILHEATLLRKKKTQKNKKICLSQSKKMTLIKNKDSQISVIL